MSEFYDHYYRCETLAEFHFYFDDDDHCDEHDDENYIYCLCSRAFIKDGVKTYYVEKEYPSESDVEVLRDSQSQDWEDHSHVHFSLDTSYKTKCERDEGASCYCSASHTDNCCSTDEQDPALTHGTLSHALQPSDSGADLTYQDYHSDTHEKLERMDQDFPNTETNEDYQSETTWDKFWAINGERLIWASWIKKYSDYINPAYLDENNDLLMDDKSMPKQHSIDQIYKEQSDTSQKETEDDSMRERKFSYDSKVNPYKKTKNLAEKTDKNNDVNKEDAWLPVGRRRSCSEHDRILSPRTLAGTDSMTNVTKLTVSSYEATSSHVTSDSTPTDDYSVSSSNSDDQSNDQTRIANIDEKFDNVDPLPLEELDTEQYWQFLWKKHFGEQYALHYANYVEQHIAQEKHLPQINIEVVEKEMEEEKVVDIECENSEGNSQEMPTVIEIQNQVEQIKIDDNTVKKRNKRKVTKKYINSVGVLLQNLLKDEQLKADEVLEAGEGNDKTDNNPQTVVETTTHSTNEHRSVDNSNFNSYSYDDGDDDPPEETSITLKRSHELDEEETECENIKNTFQIMGFCLHPEKLPKGELIYRKRLARLRPPRYKRFASAKKTYFDEDGNPYTLDQCKDSQDEREMQTDDDCTDVKSNTDKPHTATDNSKPQTATDARTYSEPPQTTTNMFTESDMPHTATDVPTESEMLHTTTDSVVKTVDNGRNVVEEASGIPLPSEMRHTTTDVPTESEMPHTATDNVVNTVDGCRNVVEEASQMPLPNDVEGSAPDGKEKTDGRPVAPQAETKRRRRPKRYSKLESDEDSTALPPEIRDDPKMMKYWRKRHSLFHKFDEGIKLDRESWFSVTPENVAWHIANKYMYEVVLDAFCGAGGNTIQFARTTKKVIAIDIDPAKIEMARHNAAVYGVADRIEFIVGDFFELAPRLKADMVFLSPPWGGPSYSENHEYDLEAMLEPRPASELMSVARTVSSTITLYLPRNTRPDQILSLAKEVGGSVEVEQSYLDKRFVAITAYFY